MGKLLFQYCVNILVWWALVLMYTTAEREYFIPHGNLTWDDARNHCQICFKELVTLTPENSQLITQMINSEHWIGLRKNFNSTNNSSMPWSSWANGDHLFFQNWYPGWPVFKSPPPKIDCCSCSCTCPANTATEMPTSSPFTENTTYNSSFFEFFDLNVTNTTSFWDSDSENPTSYTGPSYTTSATPLKIESTCERSPMPVVPETSENESYIEDSCVAMLNFGPWVEKSCLELLPYVCYEDRFFGQVNVTDVTLNNATLTWLNATGDISHYRVVIKGAQERKYELNTLTHALVDLIPGGHYEVQVFPVKCERDLNPQNATFYTEPNKVTDLKVISVSETSVTLSWNKPDGRLDFYLIKYENNMKKLETDLNGTQILQVKGLFPGTLYTFTVLTGVLDESRWSEESYVTTNTKPGKVSSLTVSGNTNNSVQLNWTAPEGNFTGFRVKAVDINSKLLLNKEVDQEERGLLVEKLQSGSKITLSVTTLANYTTTLNYTALALEGDKETTVTYTTPGPISNLTVSTNESSLDASWDEPEGNYSIFLVLLTLDGKTEEKNTTVANVMFNGLKNSANYTVVVHAVSGDSRGPPVARSIYTRPSRPTDARAISKTSNSITFEWKAPDNAATPTYCVKLTSTFWNYSNTSEEIKSTSHTFNNLKSGSKYDFQVSALAGNHTSEAATCSKCTVPKKMEISLSMLCTSKTLLLCDDTTSINEGLNKLEKHFNDTLGDNIFWEFPQLERTRTCT